MDRSTPRQLEALSAIARLKSVEAAARELGVAQETVREDIRTLEKLLDARLFEDTEGGAIRLSAQGEAALPGVRRILAEYEALRAAMNGAVDEGQKRFGIAGSVEVREPVRAGATAAAVSTVRASIAGAPIVVGVHPSIFARLTPALAAFEDEFPDRPLSMDFDCFLVEHVALAFSEARADLALFYALGEARTIPSHLLWREGWSLFVGAGHRVASRDEVGIEDIAGEGLLLSSPVNRLRLLLDTCLVQGGLGHMQVAAESDDHSLLVEHCRTGRGILPLFGPDATRTAALPGLRRIAYSGHIPEVEVRRALNPRGAADEGIQALGEILTRGLSGR